MLRILRWLVWLATAMVVIAFAVANRGLTVVSLYPFSPVEAPLWSLLFVGIFIGLAVGWVTAWWAQGKHRRAAREARAETSKLQSELADLRRANPPPQPAQQDVVPFNGGFL